MRTSRRSRPRTSLIVTRAQHGTQHERHGYVVAFRGELSAESVELHSGYNWSFVYDDYDYSGNMLPRNGNQRAWPYNWVDNVYSMRTWAQS